MNLEAGLQMNASTTAGALWNFVSTTASPRITPALKSILLVGLCILTFLSGFSTFILRKAATQNPSESRRRKFALVFGFLSCFGGGVFLATCLLDLLPSAHDQLSSALKELRIIERKRGQFPLAEFLIAVGFFLVLFLEQIVLWWKEEWRGTTDGTSAGLESTENLLEETRRLPALLGSISTEPMDIAEHRTEDLFGGSDIHFDPEAHSVFRAFVLVFALSLHAVFEGLALGLQRDVSTTLQIFGALCIHKTVLAFSLGLRLVQSRLSSQAVALLCIVFSIMAPIGGFAGIAVVQLAQKKYADMVSGSLQAIACGTFLYVTAFEILPHELNEKGNRLWKLLMLVLGFSVICAFLLLYPAD